jgi:hypothetical protein
MRRILPLLLLALAILGCSSRPVEWENRKYPRPFSAEAREQFARDSYECERANRPIDRLVPARSQVVRLLHLRASVDSRVVVSQF